MKQKALSLILALLLCLGLAVPVLAAGQSPDVSIQWLSGMPAKAWSGYYNRELNWICVSDYVDSAVADLKTGKKIDAYDYVYQSSNGLMLAEKNGKHGFINKTGAAVIPLEYDDAQAFSDGLAPVAKEDKWGFIDKTGAVVIPLEYDYAWHFLDGLARVEKGGKWGFADKTGAMVIPQEYDYVRDFSDGLARVEKGGKYGFIDKTGAAVVPLEYDYAGNIFDSGLCWVIKDWNFGIFKNPYYEESRGFPVVPVVICVLAVLAVVSVAVFFVLRKKRSAAKTADFPPTQDDRPSIPTTPPESPQTAPTAENTAPDPGPKFCPECGNPLAPGIKFCSACGHSLKE